MTPLAPAALTILIPLRTISAANSREHWARKARRVKAERLATWAAWGAVCAEPFADGLLARALRPGETVRVLLTRVAPRMLDTGDNLPMALKGVRDQIAHQLGVDDRDPRVKWDYAQRKGGPKQYAVEVTVEAARPKGEA